MTEEAAIRTSYRRPAFAGLALFLLLFGAGAGWSSIAEVSSAVIANGTVGVFGKPKTIQHLDGGIVERIDVEAGQFVRKGDELLVLDDRTIVANLTIYRGRLRDLLVRKERLLAELDDRADFDIPKGELLARYELGDTGEAMAQQRTMMKARRTSRLGEIAQLDERIAQFEKQIEGVEGLRASKETQREVYGVERRSIEKLVKHQIAAKNQLLVYDRSAADLQGQIAEHDGDIGRLRNSIAEVEISKLQVERSFREKAIAELEETDAKINELIQQVDATEQQLARTVIRAPVDGIVHELSIFTIGGVIQPGGNIMQIVPSTERLEIEVNVDTRQIDEVVIGAQAVVRFPSFHQRTTPEVHGTVSRVSPTSVVDEKSGFAFYRTGISVSDEELASLGTRELLPGMPVEAVIPTRERTVLQYFTKPLTDSFVHAFREE
ncbi:MAG: HlyD family type I secretion periplasmic adaptor subunit [Hyphomicrobiales bacterium]